MPYPTSSSAYEQLRQRSHAIESDITTLLDNYYHTRDSWRDITAKIAESSDIISALNNTPSGNLFKDPPNTQELLAASIQLVKGLTPKRPASSSSSSSSSISADFSGILNDLQCIIDFSLSRPGAGHAIFADSLQKGLKDLVEPRELLEKVYGGNALQGVEPPSYLVATRPLREALKIVAEVVSSGGAAASEEDSELSILRRDLEHYKEAIARLTFDATEARDVHRSLAAEGRVDEVEYSYHTIIGTEERCCQAISGNIEKFTELSTAVSNEQRRIEIDLKNKSCLFDDFVRQIDEFRGGCEEDLVNLEVFSTEISKKYEDSFVHFSKEGTTLDAQLAENNISQQRVQQQIALLETRSKALEAERRAFLAEKLSSIQNREQNIAHYNAAMSFTKTRTTLLQEGIQQGADHSKLFKYFRRFLDNLTASGETFFSSIKISIDEKIHALHEKYHTIFQGMFLLCGDLCSKKQNSAHLLASELQSEEMKLALCQDTLNPSAKHHALRTRQLREDIACVSNTVASMQARSSEHITWYSPTATTLGIAEGDSTGSHPLDLLRQCEEKSGQKLLAFQRIMFGQTEVLQEEALPRHKPRPSTARTVAEEVQRAAHTPLASILSHERMTNTTLGVDEGYKKNVLAADGVTMIGETGLPADSGVKHCDEERKGVCEEEEGEKRSAGGTAPLADWAVKAVMARAPQSGSKPRYLPRQKTFMA